MKTLYVWKKPFFSVNQIDVHYVQIVFSSKSVLYYFIIYNFLSYMPKGYMKVKLIYFKKSLEGYPYSSTITIIHRSQITRKYRKWKTKSKCNSFDERKWSSFDERKWNFQMYKFSYLRFSEISGYHKVCKGRPITKKKPCNKAKVAKYYIVTVTKGKKTKKLYTKRIPYCKFLFKNVSKISCSIYYYYYQAYLLTWTEDVVPIYNTGLDAIFWVMLQ